MKARVIAVAGLFSTVAWWAMAQSSSSGLFRSQTIDLGTVVTNVERCVKWYTEVIGFEEQPGFEIPADFGGRSGLTKHLPFKVRVLTLGKAPTATKLKLMEFPNAPGARTDQQFIHSTYGFRYLTIHVNDLNASVARATQAGAKPVADPVRLPPGHPQELGLALYRDPDGNFVELVGPWRD